MDKNPHLPGSPDEFIEANMNLARSVAWYFIKAAEKDDRIKFDKDDFLSIAYLGLIKAYIGFDPTKGEGLNGERIKFSTYAVPKIRGEIWRQTRDFAYIVRNKDRKGQKFFTDSLDKPISDGKDKDTYPIDLITSYDDYDQIIIRDFLSRLQPHFRLFYELRIIRGMSQDAVGKRLGVSQISISRIEKELMRMATEYGEDRDVVGSMKGITIISRLQKVG